MIIPLHMKKIQHRNKYFVNITTGEILSIRENETMKKLFETVFRGGYKKVKIYDISGTPRMIWVHRAILESWLYFILNEDEYNKINFEKYTVDHIDFNPSNNSILNLRLMTNFHNNSRKRCKLSQKDIITCYEKYFLEGCSLNEISRSINSDKSVISRLLKTKEAEDWCIENNVPFYAVCGNGVVYNSYEELLNSVPKNTREEIKNIYENGLLSIKKISIKYRIPKSLVSIICYK